MQTQSVRNENKHENLISGTEKEAASMWGAEKVLGGGETLPYKEVIKLEVKEFVIECTESECHSP